MAHPIFSRPIFAVTASVVLIAGAGAYAVFAGHHPAAYRFASVQQGSITPSVSVSGSVEAAENAALAFQKSGQVETINVKVGDEVKRGQLIASIDTRDASAAVAEASAGLQAAEANAEKVKDGATTAQTAVAQAAVESAQVAWQNASQNVDLVKTEQATAVQNAYASLLNTSLAAIPSPGNSDSVVPMISGAYVGATEGSYALSLYQAGNVNFTTSGLEKVTGIVSPAPVPLGKDGLFIQFASTPTVNDTWTISIPNAQSPAYVAVSNAYQTALQVQTQALAASQEAVASTQAALDQAKAELSATVVPARPEDVATAEAQVAAAQASVYAAENVYADSIISAPFDGRVGSLNIKIGDAVSPGQAVGSLVSNGQPQFDVALSDADFALVHQDNAATISVTFDAYPGLSFPAAIATVDVSPTMDQGSSTYQAVLSFTTPDPRLVPGLSGDALISEPTHGTALLVPSTSVITDGDAKFLLVEQANGTPTRQQVQIGIVSGGQTEILSGVSLGDQVAVF